jgi:putative cell wall-binding protein
MLSVALVAGGLIAGAAPAAAALGSAFVAGTVSKETPSGEFVPAAGVSVTMFSLDQAADVTRTGTVGQDGSYSIPAVTAGKYRVLFNGPSINGSDHARTWLGNTPYEAQSQVLMVGPEQVTGVDAQLALGGTISGNISYAAGVQGLTGAASAFLWNAEIGEFERWGVRAVPDPTGVYAIRGLPAGEFLLRFADADDQILLSTEFWDDQEVYSSSPPVVLEPRQEVTGYDATLAQKGVRISRADGEDRFETSVILSQAAYDKGASTVFIANGLNFPDALSAGPAASRERGPILLVAPGFIPESVKSELGRLAPEQIYIVGGTPSVSAAVEDELQQYAPVHRFSGADRFETSRLVAEHFWGDDVATNRTAYLATGLNFPDALSSAPAAAHEWAPVVLVNGGAADLDEPTASLLEDLGITKTVIAGGAPSVSEGIASDLRALPFIVESYRRSGDDRFETSVDTNVGSFPLADTMFLATGFGFPDALSGAALAGAWGAPVYLVHHGCVPESVYDEIIRLKVRDIVLLGGEATLDWTVHDLYIC